MSLVIRLTKLGKKGESRYRIVVSEKRSKRDGKAVEYLGWYQKKESSNKLNMNKERLKYWLSQGAKPSKTVSEFLK